MHVINLQHRLQAARIADYLIDTYGRDTQQAKTARCTLCSFYAYTHGLTRPETKAFYGYVTDVYHDALEGGEFCE